MDTRIRSVLVLSFLFLFLVVVAFFLGAFRGPVTGAVVAGNCFVKCYNNSDCADTNPCTLDACAYPGTCGSRCTYVVQEGCTY